MHNTSFFGILTPPVEDFVIWPFIAQGKPTQLSAKAPLSHKPAAHLILTPNTRPTTIDTNEDLDALYTETH
ncbi:hypothetical protein VNI00_015004, partial [Paramarasmius palmivorus]